jgi:holo-[acyl-carrier protein] synthase
VIHHRFLFSVAGQKESGVESAALQNAPPHGTKQREQHMEIVGIGTDIVECLRVGRMIQEHGEQFLTRVYTERELRDCQARKRATEHFAARWAAKEAILKCLGTGWRRGMDWTDMEVRFDDTGKPQVLLAGSVKDIALGLRVSDIYITLAHCRAYATAYALAVRSAAKFAGP